MIPENVPPGLRYAWWAEQLADALQEVIDSFHGPGDHRRSLDEVYAVIELREQAGRTLAAFRGWEGAGLDRLAAALDDGSHTTPPGARTDDDDPRWVLTDKGEAYMESIAARETGS